MAAKNLRSCGIGQGAENAHTSWAHFYIEDGWKVRQSLKLDAGLRYEFNQNLSAQANQTSLDMVLQNQERIQAILGQIPLGRYGTSNVGQAKTVYRMGLGHRYGRRMQTISGIHYNWSMPGVTSEEYFALIRNFRRHAFLLLYLFGASPAVCKSFVAGRDHALSPRI